MWETERRTEVPSAWQTTGRSVWTGIPTLLCYGVVILTASTWTLTDWRKTTAGMVARFLARWCDVVGKLFNFQSDFQAAAYPRCPWATGLGHLSTGKMYFSTITPTSLSNQKDWQMLWIQDFKIQNNQQKRVVITYLMTTDYSNYLIFAHVMAFNNVGFAFYLRYVSQTAC